MAAPGEFLDTNIIVYAFAADPRATVAEALLARGCTTSVQVLNEFTNVARRKLRMSWPEVHDALAAVHTLCRSILSIDLPVHTEALRLAERYGYGVFDSLIIATALRGGCDRLYSEDMRHDMVVEGRLRIVNPFRGD